MCAEEDPVTVHLLDCVPANAADAAAVQAAAARQAAGAPALAGEVRGAPQVARVFCGRAAAAQPALIDGRVGAVWAPDGQPRAAFDLTLLHRGPILITG